MVGKSIVLQNVLVKAKENNALNGEKSNGNLKLKSHMKGLVDMKERLTAYLFTVNEKRNYGSINYQSCKQGQKQAFIDRLGEYEDAGLDPNEIIIMECDFKSSVSQNGKYIKETKRLRELVDKMAGHILQNDSKDLLCKTIGGKDIPFEECQIAESCIPCIIKYFKGDD